MPRISAVAQRLQRCYEKITGETEQINQGGAHPTLADVGGCAYDYYVPEDAIKICLSIQFASDYAGETSYLKFRIGAANFSTIEIVIGVSYQRKTVEINVDPSWLGSIQTLQIQMANNYGANRCKVNGNGDTVRIWCK